MLPASDKAPESQGADALARGYAAEIEALRAKITPVLPVVTAEQQSVLEAARTALTRATAEAEAAGKALGQVHTAKALVDHANGKWLGGAAKGIAQAEAALKTAKTDAEREQAKKDLAKWQADREAGLKALQEREAAYEKAKLEEPRLKQENDQAQAALNAARTAESAAAGAILTVVQPVLAGGKLDAALLKGAVLTAATPQGLAAFARQGREQAKLQEDLLANGPLLQQMLEAGGASGGRYGEAAAIYAAIQKASAKAREGTLQRLALAVALEYAVPVPQSNPATATGAPATVDPVKRYLHYEKAFLAGELDPAFKDFSVWEYRMVVECDAPDEVLAWGREMLRTYRPDHITNPDYGWRYVAAVKTDVSYGSQNVKNDLPQLHSYQNIPLNGGVCGRRAFFGRFILRSFGIPVWGVTQHKHAALSHWTPKGWVVNLGAGFHASWWDKDDAPRSGTDFLLETQARAQGAEYLKVLRARWISQVLGEQPFNDRKKVAGGFWSRIAQYQAAALAAKAVELGPLGKELAEANESRAKEKLDRIAAEETDRKVVTAAGGAITVPAVAHEKPSGSFATMKSFGGGQQVHAKGGYRTQYVIEAPRAGKYAFAARVATFTDGHKLRLTVPAANQTAEAAVPFTIGLWQQTPPVEITLAAGRNELVMELPQGSRGVTIKEFTLTPVK